MTLLALLLWALGVADLFRPRDRTATRIEAARAAGAGTVALILAGWGTGLDWRWALVVVAVVVSWVLSTPLLAVGRGRWPMPIIGLAAVIVAILASSANRGDPEGWLVTWYGSLDISSLAEVSFTRFALAVGCMVFLVESANILVRMVLAGTDAAVMDSEQTLKGGRVLGPIERIFIFAMALAGEYTALAAVIAAKGILRFPEISRDIAGRKAEYVLVGSFVSWAIALVFVPLL